MTESEGKLILSKAYSLESVKNNLEAEKLEAWICFEDEDEFNDNLERFLAILKEHHGMTPVYVQLKSPSAYKRMDDSYRVLADEKLVERLSAEWGAKNVLVREKKK